MSKVIAINGPYPLTFQGVRDAIEASAYDRQLGLSPHNTNIEIHFKDGVVETINVVGSDDYEATRVCHCFRIQHDPSLCLDCDAESLL
jgi:hypothetical protein